MAHSACKWILNNGVRAVAEATNERLAEFDETAIGSMIDLDTGYLTAKHLIQSGDATTRATVARFNAEVSARAAKLASQRSEEVIASLKVTADECEILCPADL